MKPNFREVQKKCVCVCVFNWKMACVSMDFLPSAHTAKAGLFAACILHPAIQSSLQYL